MKKWIDIYNNEVLNYGGPEQFINKKAKEKKVLINKIVQHCPLGGRILEAGCGTGANSTFLSSKGFVVTAVDNELDILNLAKRLSNKVNSKTKFIKHNIFHKYEKDFDLIFSHGVLEHFDDNKIIEAVNFQLNSAAIVIVSIPTNFFHENEKMFGDERFLSVQNWIKILNKTDGELSEVFKYKYKFDWRCILPFSKKPYAGFILRRKNEKAIRD